MIPYFITYDYLVEINMNEKMELLLLFCRKEKALCVCSETRFSIMILSFLTQIQPFLLSTPGSLIISVLLAFLPPLLLSSTTLSCNTKI